LPLAEDRTVYASSKLDVWTINVTAPDVAALAGVNNNVPGAAVAVIFREGDYGTTTTQPNAVMTIRGHTTRTAAQKSFDIELNSGQSPWRGYKKILLNKHPWDLTRARNKVAFDLFPTVPNFNSLRTQFVHLFVNDQDYGLFTQIEAPNTRFLAAHGLDPAGTIYKPNHFQYHVIDAETAADPVKLAYVIEDHGNPDLPRLQRTLADINDSGQDINDVVRRNFERQNYVTWLAVNALTGNYDTNSQNFLLYGPSGCQGWYMMPWDYDGALEFYQQPGEPVKPRYFAGLGDWWQVELHRRFLQDPNNFHDVDAMVTRLYQQQLTDDAVHQLMTSYHDVVRPFISVSPDLDDLPTHLASGAADRVAQWEAEFARVANGLFTRRYGDYRAAILRPMPVWLSMPDPPSAPGGPYTFTWSQSYMLTGGAFSYDLEISRTAAFAPGDLVVRQTGLRQAIAMITLAPGAYYYHVIIRADAQPDVNWQTQFGADQQLTVGP
jgi:spore coat protein H